MKMNRSQFGGAYVLLTCLFAGCTSSGEQVWTTKSQSMLGVKTDTPSLNIGELPVASASLTAKELREPAISVLLQAVDAPNPLLRANAIEALHHAPEYLEIPVRRGLGDENRGVRFVAAMTVGKLKMREMAQFVEPLLHDESLSVQAAAMYGLKRVSPERKIDLTPLSATLWGENPEDKGNAAYVLGEIGDATAIPMIRQAAGRGLTRVPQARRKIVELQLAEALVKLGSMRELVVIRAALFAPAEEGELAALACQMCGELNDGGALPDLSNLIHRVGRFERPPEVRMAAALAVARLDPSRALVEVPAAYAGNSRPYLRAQAAHTLGAMNAGGKESIVALSHLSRLLGDPDPVVQVAAARGILQMQPRSPF